LALTRTSKNHDRVDQVTKMTTYYFPFGLIVGGMLFYHLGQKAIPKGMNPFVATIIAYAAGITLCVFAALISLRNKSFYDSAKETNWAVVVMGIAAAAIEIGFMLAYRVGWRISLTAVATNVTVTALLVPIGLLSFKEHLSLRNAVGLVFCILGLVLVGRE
jgi:uncharacterized membrane protein